MSIIRFEELDSDGFTDDTNGSAEASYLVVVSDVYEAKQAIDEARPDLLRGEPHPTIPGLYVSSRRCNQTAGIWKEDTGKTEGVYELRVSYGSAPLSTGIAPYDEPARYEVGSNEYMRPVHTDLDGRPIVNTAGQRIELSRAIPGWIIRVSKNFAALPKSILALPNAINSRDVRMMGLNWPAYTLRCKGVSIGDLQQAESLFDDYREVSFEFHFDPAGHRRPVLNMGTVAIPPTVLFEDENGVPIDDDEPPKAEPILRDDQPVKEPQFLDEEGRDIVALKGEVTPDDVVTLNFKLAPELDFRKLPLF